MPVGEVGWHAGSHDGNAKSIGIEICENKGIDQQAANDKAARLTALLLHELGISPAGNVTQHHLWIGKNCPALLRKPSSGWDAFLVAVENHFAQVTEGPGENDDAISLDVLASIGAAGRQLGGERSSALDFAQHGILSTEFGGGSEAGMLSAYGGLIDPNHPQAALPARIPRTKTQILVTNPSNGLTVVCRVNDVGPWNTHDSYWDHGSRPASEAQYEHHLRAEDGRVPSNRAGLDLTPAAMLALRVSGQVNTRQVVVNWQFA